MDILAQLKLERDKAAQQVKALDTAINALSGMNRSGRGSAAGPRRRISAAGRARIAAAARARWAKIRATKNSKLASARSRRISAAGLANIRAAQRARWAKLRKQKKAA